MQLDFWQILFLAVVQGLTEFLPISSSGHLVVISAMLSPGDPQQLDIADLSVVLHMGTLLSILIYYWKRIGRLLGDDRRVIRCLIIGTLPAVIVGFTIESTCKHLIEFPLLAGIMLPITGLILIWGGRRLDATGEYVNLSNRDALLIGLSQAFAILPGVSRSGTTISTGLRLGLSPRSAATFSFLLAIPAVAGAGLLKAISLATRAEMSTPIPHLLAGGLVSFVVGLLALHWLLRWLERGRFQLFAWWCIPLGIVVTVWEVWQLSQ